MADSHTALLPFDAVLFDLDGVLTSTAKIHADCWKSLDQVKLAILRRVAPGEEGHPRMSCTVSAGPAVWPRADDGSRRCPSRRTPVECFGKPAG